VLASRHFFISALAAAAAAVEKKVLTLQTTKRDRELQAKFDEAQEKGNQLAAAKAEMCLHRNRYERAKRVYEKLYFSSRRYCRP
jgi:hypothetical protein